MSYRILAFSLLWVGLCSKEASAGCQFSVQWDYIHQGQVMQLSCQSWNTDHCDIQLEAGDTLRVAAIMNCQPGTIQWFLNGSVFLTVTGYSSMHYFTHSGEYKVTLHSVNGGMLATWHLTIPNANDPETSTGPFANVVEPTPEVPFFLAYDDASNSIVGHVPTTTTGTGEYHIYGIDGRSEGGGTVSLTAGDGNFGIDVGRIPESLVIVEVRFADQVYRSKLFLP